MTVAISIFDCRQQGALALILNQKTVNASGMPSELQIEFNGNGARPNVILLVSGHKEWHRQCRWSPHQSIEAIHLV